jgi:hypothetical protein
MKKILSILCFVLCFTVCYGQEKKKKIRFTPVDFSRIALFVDSIYVGIPWGINPDSIDSMKMLEKPIKVNNELFEACIYLFSHPQKTLISLQEVIEKYIKGPIYTPIFMIDNRILKGNAFSYKVEEDYILSVKHINSNELGYWENRKLFTIVSILTKTKENMEGKLIDEDNLPGSTLEERKKLHEYFRHKKVE